MKPYKWSVCKCRKCALPRSERIPQASLQGPSWCRPCSCYNDSVAISVELLIIKLTATFHEQPTNSHRKHNNEYKSAYEPSAVCMFNLPLSLRIYRLWPINYYHDFDFCTSWSLQNNSQTAQFYSRANGVAVQWQWRWQIQCRLPDINRKCENRKREVLQIFNQLTTTSVRGYIRFHRFQTIIRDSIR